MDEWRESVAAVLANHAACKIIVKQQRDRLAKLEAEFIAADQAQGIAQGIAREIQQMAHEKIAAVVSSCLQAVFDDPYEFKLYFEEKRGKTEARIAFIRGEMELDPIDASGGGVIDVASFAIRLATLILSKPARRRVLIADEPFRFISADRIPRVAEMLDRLSVELNVQFIMVTHIAGLRIGEVIDLGVSQDG